MPDRRRLHFGLHTGIMKERFGRNILTVGGLTGISRILGYIRDMVTAWLLGATGLADAFFIALQDP